MRAFIVVEVKVVVHRSLDIEKIGVDVQFAFFGFEALEEGFNEGILGGFAGIAEAGNPMKRLHKGQEVMAYIA